jgi:hypothetical protein
MTVIFPLMKRLRAFKDSLKDSLQTPAGLRPQRTPNPPHDHCATSMPPPNGLSRKGPTRSFARSRWPADGRQRSRKHRYIAPVSIFGMRS